MEEQLAGRAVLPEAVRLIIKARGGDLVGRSRLRGPTSAARRFVYNLTEFFLPYRIIHSRLKFAVTATYKHDLQP
jgi:hypothetical protein